MPHEVRFSPDFDKSISKITKNDAWRIIEKIKEASKDPDHFLKPLKKVECYKLRVGKYRVFLDWRKESGILLVLDVGLRKNVYDGKIKRIK